MKSLGLILLTLPCLLMAAEVPSQFTRQTTAAAVANLNHWWTNFHDEQLNQLIADAVAGNPNLTAAAARLREARARRLAAAADYYPQLSTKGSAVRSLPSSNGTFATGQPIDTYNLFDASLDASWEIDVFGRTRNNVAAAKAQEQASQAAQGNVMLSLIAELTSNYVELRGLQSQLNVLRANLDSQEKTLELTRSRLKAGLSPELVVAQSEAQVAITRASLPSVEAAIAAAMHRIASLTGKTAGSYVQTLQAPKAIPSGPSTVPAGLPSELLQRRPDVIQAERSYAAATAQVGAAKAARWPKLTIGTSVGLQSKRTSSFTDSDSHTWSVGPQISIPLFTGGKLKQNQAAAEAARDEAQSAWDQAVLVAIEDVETALVNYRQAQARVSALKDAEKASNRAYELANELYKNGLGDFLNVLEAQRTQLSAQEQVVIAQRQVSLDLVKLYKALGGGWDNATPATVTPKK
jgi:multidrug efflux system outer membrane protein